MDNHNEDRLMEWLGNESEKPKIIVVYGPT